MLSARVVACFLLNAEWRHHTEVQRTSIVNTVKGSQGFMMGENPWLSP